MDINCFVNSKYIAVVAEVVVVESNFFKNFYLECLLEKNNIYFNICSKSAKGSSTDLTPLIAAYLKISLTVKIEQTRRKNHMLVVNRNGWTEKKRLGRLIQLYISFKISIRNTEFKANQLISQFEAQCHLFPSTTKSSKKFAV